MKRLLIQVRSIADKISTWAPLRSFPGYAGIGLISIAFYMRFGAAAGLFVLGLFALRVDSRQ